METWIQFIIGILLIVGGADVLVKGSSALARRLGLSEFIVGLTVMAIGTSTPELAVSLISAVKGSAGAAVGNVVGSNIFNVFAALGICAVIAPVALTGSNMRRDIPAGVAAAALLLLFKAIGYIPRGAGIAMIVLYTALIIYTVRTSRERTRSDSDSPRMPLLLAVIMIATGIASLICGGDTFLDSATTLARHWGMSEAAISVTLVAAGTSMPELVSSVVALCRGKGDMALGNIIGSNTVNILVVLGISAAARPLSLHDITLFDLGIMTSGMILIFISAYTFLKRRVDRIEGIIFVAIYVIYILRNINAI
ncbi:MAG: calcium/sodium antiporter [Alistipes sp.]|nr:calcium/sodium antiporter [Alistipes sp.]